MNTNFPGPVTWLKALLLLFKIFVLFKTIFKFKYILIIYVPVPSLKSFRFYLHTHPTVSSFSKNKGNPNTKISPSPGKQNKTLPLPKRQRPSPKCNPIKVYKKILWSPLYIGQQLLNMRHKHTLRKR